MYKVYNVIFLVIILKKMYVPNASPLLVESLIIV